MLIMSGPAARDWVTCVRGATLEQCWLGFGTASLHSAVSTQEAVALLETALDHGVTHFDTARAYGWGKTEALLGVVAARRRDEMFIVSKAGIAPPSLLGRAMRKLGLRLPGAREPQFGQFAPAQVQRSVEQSLRALKTDRLDAMLLHEIEAASVTDELKRAVEDLKTSGKALRIGIATDNAASAAIAAEHPELCDIVQVAAPPIGVRAKALGRVPVRHSVLGPRLRQFAADLNADKARAELFADETGLDPQDVSALARLLLAEASRGALVLFSSTRADHIIDNASLLRSANDAVAVEGLERFLAAA